VARALLEGAIAYAKKRGVALLEAYPFDKPGRGGDDSRCFGAKWMYDAAAFKGVAGGRPAGRFVRIRPA